MAKEASFSIAAPPSGSLLAKMGEFLVQRAARQADLEAGGICRERAPGDTDAPVRWSGRAMEEVS